MTDKKNIKLVLFDLDGTLLDENSKVPPNFNDVIDKLKAKGIRAGIATGRNYSSINYLFSDVFNKMVFITCNGSNIYVDGKEIYCKYIEKEAIKNVFEIASNMNNATSQIITKEGITCLEGDIAAIDYGEHGYKINSVNDISCHLDGATMMTVITDKYPNGYSEFFKPINNQINFFQSWYKCLDITPFGVTKGTGAKTVAKYLNININDVLAFGDYDNDLELLKTVGFPVAMLNGNDNVKKIAKDITYKTNVEYGTLDYLINNFL